MRLEARDLAFGYPGHPVGRGVTLAFEAGEVVCLLGPNGGGKTTFFRTLLGLLAPQGGAVLVDGRNLAQLARADIARQLSYVPQAHAGYFPFTVRDIVLMGRTAHLGVFAAPSRHDRIVAEDAIARMGLSHLAESEYAHLRRRAPARADRPRARAGGADCRHGRADREPGLRQPGESARAGARARRHGHRRRNGYA